MTSTDKSSSQNLGDIVKKQIAQVPKLKKQFQQTPEIKESEPREWMQRDAFSRREKWLYTLTMLLELPGAVARLVFFFFFGPILLFPIYIILLAILYLGDLMELVLWVNVCLAAILAAANVVVSVMTAKGVIFAKLTGNTLTRYAAGARVSSKREQEAMLAALERIQANAPGKVKAPTHWYVVDAPTPNAYVVGTTLYVTRELLRTPYLAAVVAHEFGHLNSPDGRLTLALRRLVMPYTYLLNQTTGNQAAPGVVIMGDDLSNNRTVFVLGVAVLFLAIMLALAGGGLGLFLLNPFWVWHWREREYYADNFAARCGLGQELVEYLEKHQFFDTATPFFMSSHPYTELRIDKLLAYLDREGVSEDMEKEVKPV